MFHHKIVSQNKEDICIWFNLDNYSKSFMVDCGMARNLTPRMVLSLEVLFVSHTHIDHFINFDYILRHQIKDGGKMIIFGPKGIAKQVQAKVSAYLWNLIDRNFITYEIREIIDLNTIIKSEITAPHWELENKEIIKIKDNIIFRNKKMVAKCTLLNHKTNVVAYLFKEHDSINIDISKINFHKGSWMGELKASFINKTPKQTIQIENKTFVAEDLFKYLYKKNGDSLGVIMDHAPSKENHKSIIELFQGCNTVLIESYFKNEDKSLAEQKFHSYASQSGEVLRKAQVKNAIPIHFSKKYSVVDIKKLKLQFYTAFDKELNC